MILDRFYLYKDGQPNDPFRLDVPRPSRMGSKGDALAAPLPLIHLGLHPDFSMLFPPVGFVCINPKSQMGQRVALCSPLQNHIT